MAKKRDAAEVDMTPLNIEVPTALHRAVKVAAINAGKTLKEFVAETLGARVGVPVDATERRPAKPRK